MRLLYLGLPLGAVVLSQAGYRPQVVCVGHPDAPGSRRLRRRLGARGALVLGRPDLRAARVRALLASTRPELLLSFFWPFRIPEEVLALPSVGALGTHPSLLPRWRGPDPCFWAIARGDRVTGVTLHHLTAGYDEGPIVAQEQVPIPDRGDAFQLARRLDRPAVRLLLDAARRVAAGEALAGRPQDDAASTWAPRPSDDELMLDWRRPASELDRLVRAAAPFPGAAAHLRDRYVEVVEAHVAPGRAPAALRPGEAFRTATGWTVRCGDGRGLALDRLRGADGAMVDVDAWLAPGLA